MLKMDVLKNSTMIGTSSNKVLKTMNYQKKKKKNRAEII
jgi:hypothetical protein